MFVGSSFPWKSNTKVISVTMGPVKMMTKYAPLRDDANVETCWDNDGFVIINNAKNYSSA
jgi:hypothetical protein